VPVFHSPARHVVYVKGRRAGGTYGAVLRLVELSRERPGSRHLWADLTQRHILRYVRRYFEPLLGGTRSHFDMRTFSLRLPGGAVCDFGSAQRPELMEGHGYGNFAALAAGAPGAPPLHVDAVSSLALVHAASGFLGPQVSSLGTLQVASGLLAPQASSLGTVHAASGFVGPQVSSLGTLQVASGLLAPQVSSLGTVHVAGGLLAPQVASLGTVWASDGLATTGVASLAAIAVALGHGAVQVNCTNFAHTETMVACVSLGTAGNQVWLEGLGRIVNVLAPDQKVHLAIRVGSPGGTLVASMDAFAATGTSNFAGVLGQHASSQGTTVYNLTAANGDNNTLQFSGMFRAVELATP
jgi:hypothetical protein